MLPSCDCMNVPGSASNKNANGLVWYVDQNLHDTPTNRQRAQVSTPARVHTTTAMRAVHARSGSSYIWRADVHSCWHLSRVLCVSSTFAR